MHHKSKEDKSIKCIGKAELIYYMIIRVFLLLTSNKKNQKCDILNQMKEVKPC